MDTQKVAEVLQQTLLDLSNQITLQTSNFLNLYIQPLYQQAPAYHIFAAAAIVCQCKMVRSLENGKLVQCGIRTQKIMRHLPNLSKQKFLETIKKQIDKYQGAPIWLRPRIHNIEKLYRIFKKYRESFIALCQADGNLQQESIIHLLHLFWMVFLHMKNSRNQFQNQSIAIKALLTLLPLLFYRIGNLPGLIGNVPIQKIQRILFAIFDQVGILQDNLEIIFHCDMIKVMEQAYNLRYLRKKFQLAKFLKSQQQIIRITDDLIISYHQKRVNSNQSIDQEIFLQLDKTLPPQSKETQFYTPIKLKLNLASQEEQIDHSNPLQNIKNIIFPLPQNNNHNNRILNFKNISEVSPISKYTGPTPLNSQYQNMNWINSCIDSISESDKNKISFFYQKLIQRSYSQMYNYLMDTLNQILVLQTFTQIQSKQRTKDIIYNLYIYLLIEILKDQQNIPQKIVSRIDTYKQLFCLAIQFYNYAYRSITLYNIYCQKLSISILGIFIPINWIGRKLNLTKDLTKHLFEIQQKILMRDIWQDGTGYRLLLSLKQNVQSIAKVTSIVMFRLSKQISSRIQQLVLPQYKQLYSKVFHLVQQIMDKKMKLLQKNYIDHIIICSINFFSKELNQKHQLKDTFNRYNLGILSFQSMKQNLWDLSGNKLNIYKFYNTIFLRQIYQLIYKQSQTNYILPIQVFLERFQDHSQKKSNNYQVNLCLKYQGKKQQE